MFKFSVSAFSLVGCACVGLLADAATLALYDFEDNDLLSNDTEAETSAGALTSGMNGSFDLESFYGQNNNEAVLPGFEISTLHLRAVGRSTAFNTDRITGRGIAGTYGDIKADANGQNQNVGSSTLAQAIANKNYIAFTVSLGTAESFDITQFSIEADITDNETTAKNYWLTADDAGEAFDTGDLIGPNTLVFGGDSTLVIDTFSVSTFTADTEFRLYFATFANEEQHGIAFDDITLQGTVTVPQPTSLAPLVLGGLMALRRRRG